MLDKYFNYFRADNEENNENEVKKEEKKITEEEFNEAVERIIEKDDSINKGRAGFFMGLSGIIFASMLRKELFGESEE